MKERVAERNKVAGNSKIKQRIEESTNSDLSDISFSTKE